MLTPLQDQILILVLAGLTNREIAFRLEMTPGGVGTQIGRIVLRLGLARRSEICAGFSGNAPALRAPLMQVDEYAGVPGWDSPGGWPRSKR